YTRRRPAPHLRRNDLTRHDTADRSVPRDDGGRARRLAPYAGRLWPGPDGRRDLARRRRGPDERDAGRAGSLVRRSVAARAVGRHRRTPPRLGEAILSLRPGRGLADRRSLAPPR